MTATQIREAVESAITDLIADHPMWIGADGEGLDYLPEREARIADFVGECTAAVMRSLDAPWTPNPYGSEATA